MSASGCFCACVSADACESLGQTFLFFYFLLILVSGQNYRVNRLYPWDFWEERNKGGRKIQEEGKKYGRGVKRDEKRLKGSREMEGREGGG